MTLSSALFLGHGSPENVVLDNRFTQHLKHCGQQLAKPRAILMISAHWLTQGVYITSAIQPKQIFDFYGFPPALYEVQYPAKTDQNLVQQLLAMNIGIVADPHAGFDHGTWTVLKHLFPQADVPVVQMSLNTQFTRQQHLEFAQKLQDLRHQGVMIMGSGNVVHNLGLLDWQQREQGADWAISFDMQIKAAIKQHDLSFLTQTRQQMSQIARLAIPSEDHYWPLLYVAGVRQDNDVLSWLDEGYEYGSIALRSFIYANIF